MSEPQKMYHAHAYFGLLHLGNPEQTPSLFTTSMELTACGRYVQRTQKRMDQNGYETVRFDVSDWWQPTPAKALAIVAPRLRQIAGRLMRQADELEQAALEENAKRPALAEK